MTKDEILAKSREDNKTRDEMEKSVFFKSGQTACAVGGMVCMLIVIMEEVVKNTFSFSGWSIFLSMTGTMLVSKYRILKKPLYIVAGAAELIIAAAFLGIYVYKLMR